MEFLFQPYTYTISNQAQMFHADDSLKIIGVAGYVHIRPDALIVNNYLGMADTSFNILEEKVLSYSILRNGLIFPYYEVMFDNPKKVIGDFYVLTDFARPHKYIKNDQFYEDTLYGTKYNWYGSYSYFGNMDYEVVIPTIMTDDLRCTKQPLRTKQSFYVLYPCGDTTNEGSWLDTYDTSSFVYTDYNDPATVYFRNYIRRLHGMYLFPLIGDDDTTSVIDTTGTDTTSSIISPQVENFTYVFPNPAKENITIQSSFKMRNIEIYNEQGQKVKEYKPASYNTTIDISNLAKGNYIIKIITKYGIAIKKIVVQ